MMVCGLGDMAQGHKPDEFVTEAQLTASDVMLSNLVTRLVEGI
jgi:acetylornithine deacetylase